MPPVFDYEKCTGCGACDALYPADAIYMQGAETPDALPEVSRRESALRIMPAGLPGGGHHHYLSARHAEYITCKIQIKTREVPVKVGKRIFIRAFDWSSYLVMDIGKCQTKMKRINIEKKYQGR